MHYLSKALAKRGGFLKPLGMVLAFVYAILVVGASLGGGNMFQSNQAFHQFELLVL